MKKCIAALCFALITQLVLADQIAMKKDHPDVYYVKKGDTLWDISNMFLNDPWYWPQIWHINPQVENPHLIYPGDKLALVNINGEQKITVVDRPNGKTVRLSPAGDGGAAGPNDGKTNGDYKLKPKVRITPVESAIAAIPLDKISPFITDSRVTTPLLLEESAYVIAGDNKRLLTGPGDRLFARGEFNVDEPAYGVYRPGKTYVDPITEEVLGVEAKDLGQGRMVALDENNSVATILINQVHGEIRIGDRLMPSEQKRVTARFLPSAPEDEINAIVIGIEEGKRQFGPWDVIALNKGERDELKPGNILAVYQKGEVVKDKFKKEDVQLPDTRAGLVMVFRTFEKMSFALVLKSDRPLGPGDSARNP